MFCLDDWLRGGSFHSVTHYASLVQCFRPVFFLAQFDMSSGNYIVFGFKQTIDVAFYLIQKQSIYFPIQFSVCTQYCVSECDSRSVGISHEVKITTLKQLKNKRKKKNSMLFIVFAEKILFQFSIFSDFLWNGAFVVWGKKSDTYNVHYMKYYIKNITCTTIFVCYDNGFDKNQSFLSSSMK